METIAEKTLSMVQKQTADNYVARKQEFIERIRDEFLDFITKTHIKVETNTPYEFEKESLGYFSSYELMKFGTELGFSFSQNEKTLHIMIIPRKGGKETSIFENMIDDVNEELHEYLQEIRSQVREICNEIEEKLQAWSYTCVQIAEDSYEIIVPFHTNMLDFLITDEIKKVAIEQWHFQDATVLLEENEIHLFLNNSNTKS